MRSFTCVSVVVYVARKLRLCPSYIRRRDRIYFGTLAWLRQWGGGSCAAERGLLGGLLHERVNVGLKLG